jgi:hypothetical protein
MPIFFSKCGAQSSTAIYLPDFVVGFQPSGRVESCCRGIGYPTTRNGCVHTVVPLTHFQHVSVDLLS